MRELRLSIGQKTNSECNLFLLDTNSGNALTILRAILRKMLQTLPHMFSQSLRLKIRASAQCLLICNGSGELILSHQQPEISFDQIGRPITEAKFTKFSITHFPSHTLTVQNDPSFTEVILKIGSAWLYGVTGLVRGQKVRLKASTQKILGGRV